MIDDRQAFWKGIRKPLIIAVIAVLLYELCENFESVRETAAAFFDLLRPVTNGIIVAFLVNMPLKFLERNTRRGRTRTLRKLRRPICLLASYLFIILIIVCLSAVIVPRIAESIQTFAENFSIYQKSLGDLIEGFWNKLKLDGDAADWLIKRWDAFIAYTEQLAADIVPELFKFTLSLVTGLYNAVLALIVSVFLLYNKEKFISQIKRVITALCPRHAPAIIEFGSFSSNVIYRFIMGQTLMALILGIICFIGMTIIGLPYAVLISVVIAATSLVPIVGPFIGTIPSAFIILMIDPVKALWFILFILVLHQLEGDLIYPRVVGNAIGLSGFWVLLAVILWGGLFGLTGVLLGVPLTAVLYELMKRWIKSRERRNRETDNKKAFVK
jgi:predicted PurR-regulated permease PerM